MENQVMYLIFALISGQSEMKSIQEKNHSDFKLLRILSPKNLGALNE